MQKLPYQLNKRRMDLLKDQGVIELENVICPYVTVESIKGKKIASLESEKQAIKACLSLVEILLCLHDRQGIHFQSLLTSFYQNFDKAITGEFLNDLIKREKWSSKPKLQQALKVLIANQANHYLTNKVAGEQVPELRLALKPMEKGEGLYGFYCLSKGLSNLNTKTLIAYRRVVKHSLSQIEASLDSHYKSLHTEYESTALSGLYNLGYRNIASI